MAEEEKGPEKKPEELPTIFRDERGREWCVRLTVRIMREFCARYSLRMDQAHPAQLNSAQLLDLAYEGTRYQSRALMESRDDFLDALEGPSFCEAQGAASRALVNFILRVAPKRQEEKPGAAA